MSVSGVRAAADIDLEDFEKRLRAAGSPSGGGEDPLAELARLVEASRPKSGSVAMAPPVAAPAPPPHPPVAPAPSPRVAGVVTTPSVAAAPPAPPPQTASVVTTPSVAAAAPPPPPVEPVLLEPGALRPAIDGPGDANADKDLEPENAEAAELAEGPEAELYPENPSTPPQPFAGRQSRRWLLTVSGLALAGVVMIGAVAALKGGVPGMSKQPPFIAAAVGPTKVQPPSDETVSASNDGGGNLLKDNTQANRVKVVNNEEQPVDLNAQTAAPAATPAPAALPGGPVVRGTVDTPVVVAAPTTAPTPASPFPEPKPVRTISLRPDGTPIQATVGGGSATSQAPTSQPVQAPQQPQPKPASKTPADAANAQPSTPKIDLPTKLPGKSSARVVVAKTDTTAPGGAAEAPGEPVKLGGAVAKPEKPAKAKTEEAAAEPAAPAAAEPGAASSGGWSVQLAAPRSEAEATSVMNKLKDKYASALGGSWLGVRKATVNGETIYRVRVNGLSKADAASLCARVKGDGGQCFVAK